MDTGELTRTCWFRTPRLDVADWHKAARQANASLIDVITTLMTPETTHALPSSWRGDYDANRARAWIGERDEESATLLAVERATGMPIGMLILFEMPDERGSDRVDLRVGYLIDASAWGRGLATEVVAGFVEWCRSSPRIRTIAGGVGSDNTASAKVLVKNGFVPVGPGGDEQLYELRL